MGECLYLAMKWADPAVHYAVLDDVSYLMISHVYARPNPDVNLETGLKASCYYILGHTNSIISFSFPPAPYLSHRLYFHYC